MGRGGDQALRARWALSRIVRRPAARRDAVELWRHIAADNRVAADALIDRIDEALQLLSANPLLGRERPELQTNLRSFVVGNYVLLYEPLVGGLRLIRVLHGARDIAAEFGRR